MSKSLAKRLDEEINRIRARIEKHKRRIKRNIHDTRLLHRLELELRALDVRLSELTNNKNDLRRTESG